MIYSFKSLFIDEKYNVEKYKIVKDYLRFNYRHIFEKNYNTDTIPMPQKIVWIFWWQGKEFMPPICKYCYNSLVEQNKDICINFVDKNNYRNYIEIPSHILEKVEKKIFSVTNFSDIIRVMLLAKYGGIWVDATLYFVNPIPDEWFNMGFFSIKNQSEGYKFISRNQWSTFIMGTNLSSTYFKRFSDLMIAYGERENSFIEYMTMDYFMDLLFDMPEYKELLTLLPYQNEDLHELRKIINTEYNQEKFNTLKQNNICFKLSYKMNFYNEINNKPTFFKFISNYES